MTQGDRTAAIVAHILEARAKAERMLAGRTPQPILPDVMTPDHPIARAIGFERANALVDTPARRRAEKAQLRRDEVRRLSLEGRPVREIAATLELSYDYIVALRSQLGVGRSR